MQVLAADADQIRSAYICSMNYIQPGELDFQGTLKESEYLPPVSFISKECHSATTPEVLSNCWLISIAQAKMTLKSTPRKLLRSALMHLAQRYRVDRVFETPQLRCKMVTDTMDAIY